MAEKKKKASMAMGNEGESSVRTMRKDEGTTPLAIECIPSVSTSTVRTPLTRPRRLYSDSPWRATINVCTPAASRR